MPFASLLIAAGVSIASTLIASALAPAPPAIGKLNNLTSPKSELGGAIPTVWGTVRVKGNGYYTSRLVDKVKEGGSFLGTGVFKQPDVVKYRYLDYGVLFNEGESQLIGKVFANGKTIGIVEPDITGNSPFIILKTNYFRDAGVRMGTDNDSNLSYSDRGDVGCDYNYITKIIFRKLKISEFGNQIPDVEALITGFSDDLAFILTDILQRGGFTSGEIGRARVGKECFD